MYDFNYNHEDSNVNELILQYEGMLATGNSIFLEQDAFQDLIDYYEDQIQYPKALEVIEYAVIQYPFSAVFYIRKAQLLLEEDQLDAATTALNAAKLYEPSNIDIFLTESEILHQSEDYHAALAMLDTAMIYADSGDWEDIYMMQASIYESMEDYEASFYSLEKALTQNPFNEMAFSRLWLCMELTEAYEEGITVHLRIIDEAPYSYWAWYNLGHAYMQLGLYEKAFEAYDYAIVINEDFEFAYRDIIACLFRLEDYVLAERYVDDYKKRFDVDAEVMLWEGECYEYQGDYDNAREIYIAALKFDMIDGQLHYRIGVTYANQNSWKQALRSFEQAYQHNKDNEEYCIALAEVYNQLDDVEMAHTYYNQAIVLAPEETIVWISYLEFLIDEESYSAGIETLADARGYSENRLYDLAEVALLLLSGQRHEGVIKLIQVLEEDTMDIPKLFSIEPELENDDEVMTILHDYVSRNLDDGFNLNWNQK